MNCKLQHTLIWPRTDFNHIAVIKRTIHICQSHLRCTAPDPAPTWGESRTVKMKIIKMLIEFMVKRRVTNWANESKSDEITFLALGSALILRNDQMSQVIFFSADSENITTSQLCNWLKFANAQIYEVRSELIFIEHRHCDVWWDYIVYSEGAGENYMRELLKRSWLHYNVFFWESEKNNN